MTASDALRVAVIGGGIGGMATATALHHHGLDVHLYEQAPALTEIGAGVMMTPNSVRLLQRLGLGEAVSAAGGFVSDGSSYCRADGTPVAPILTTDSSGWNGMCGMHRADLLALLGAAIPSDRLHTDHRCVSFRQDEDGAEVTFANGQHAHADVVVAADGIHSTLQHEVVPPSEPIDSGSVAYRGLVPATQIPEWPARTYFLWMGDHRHFLLYPVRGGELLNYVAFVPSDARVTESWTALGDVDALRAEFAGWDPRINRLLAEVEQTNYWGLYDRAPLPRWTEGRLTLLGDAAHPMLPHLGQGANQSIEDALALGVFLAGANADSAPQALQAYESLRRHRTDEVQTGARANGRRYDSDFEDLADRDAELAATITFRKWLYDYDAEAAARDALAVS